MTIPSIYKQPSHVDDYKKGLHYSNVFHGEHPGLIVATFYGKHHIEMSEAFTAVANAAYSSGQACKKMGEKA